MAVLKIPVFYITNDYPLARWSRHIKKSIRWSGPQTACATEELLKIAELYKLRGALLIPASDQDVKFVSQNTDVLATRFILMTPEWERLKWLCDKPNLYRRADELQIAHPMTYHLTSYDDVYKKDFHFPIVLKPNMGGGDSALAKAKVLKVDDKPSFIKVFQTATREIGLEKIVIQRLIPGDGDTQLSYAAFWHDGRPVGEFTARRSRQYPVDFGFTSTFVETINAPEAITSARKILSSVRYSGLVEVEFKRDPTNGMLNILDVNPRPWSWFALSGATGMNITQMMWDVMNNRQEKPALPAHSEAAWMYLSRDLVAAVILMMRGKLRIREYLASLLRVRAWAAFSWSDLKPGIVDLPITIFRVIKRRIYNK
ncbi:ATP-grasp domain-containing protein [Ochrobactrum sp. Marseille-Q0166]|uniref:carboxylate--amine ligase n=1 Tax=Ochrobactrum sp. Marseille-Q0166 TaxID=2761105 RepID=UPI001FFE35CA|nr:ATP-grasp domain-containing protein [Ochrobactrum sp. Marseille-Q0166]